MATNSKLQALQNLSAQIPVASNRIAQGQKAARDLQIQQAVQQAPTGAQTAPLAGQLGAAAAQQAGQQRVEQVGKDVATQGRLTQVDLAGQQQQAQAATHAAQQAAVGQELAGVQRLAEVSEGAKRALYDSQMQFEKDEMGRTLFNESQLADYMKLNARNEQQVQKYIQDTENLSKKKLQAMEHAYRLVQEDLAQKEALAVQRADNQSRMQVEQMKAEVAQRMQREKARAQNRKAQNNAVGMVLGAVGGAVAGVYTAGVGAPAGAAAGMAVGGALGNMYSTQTE